MAIFFQRYFLWICLISLAIMAVVTAQSLLLIPKSQGLSFVRSNFADIQGWQDDNFVHVISAYEKSCEKVRLFAENRLMGGSDFFGKVQDWQPLCSHLTQLKHTLDAHDQKPLGAKAQSSDTDFKNEQYRSFFETYFVPYAVLYHHNPIGKFTGYYEPLLYGHSHKTERYQTPLLARPQDLIMVDLGQFRHDLKGRRIAGKLENGRLLPYADRAEIIAGAIDDKTTALLWVDDPIMAFSLHIQGSGRIQMSDGRLVNIGYAAQNGHPYRSIGRLMVKKGLLKADEISMPAIQKWLKDNPDQAQDIMNSNPSYIFMRMIEGEGPYGSAGVVLTPERSLAIDRNYLPLNIPIFLSTRYPDPKDRLAPAKEFNKLMMTQDTGGAIRGGIRGDVFWGFGPRAEEIAGRMAHQGSYFVLIPKKLSQQTSQR